MIPKVVLLAVVCTAAGGAQGLPRNPAPRPNAFYYRGKCQSAVASFPFSTPSAAAPSFVCVNSGSAVTAVASWANNTSNQSVQDQFMLPPGFLGEMTVEVTGRSADSAHAALLTFSWACVDSNAIDNPSFTPAPAFRFTASAPNMRTVASTSLNTSCTAGQDLYWKLVVDTTGLTGGVTFDLIALRFSTAASR